MSNIWKIFTLELRQLFSNVVTIIITLGLVLMPSLFTWYNVLSCWDVFDNTGDLKVAVASLDRGYESELFPLEVNVGEEVISALRANEQIDWVFTDADDAVDGARAGRYYAAVVIPEEFSRSMLTFYQDEAESAPLVYYTNEKKNAIAPKITDQGADGVSYQVNQVFAQTLADISLKIAKSVSQYMDDATVQSRIGALTQDLDTMGQRVEQASTVLSLFSSLSGSAEGLLESSNGLLVSVQDSADQAAQNAESSLSAVTSIDEQLNKVADNMMAAVDSSIALVKDLESKAGEFAHNPKVEETAQALRDRADALDEQFKQYDEMLKALTGKDALPAGEDAADEGLSSDDNLEAARDALTAAVSELQQLRDNLRKTADGIEAGNVEIDPALLANHAKEAREKLEELRVVIDGDVRAALAGVADQVGQLQDSVSLLVGKLNMATEGVSESISGASAGLGNASSSIAAMAGKMATVSGVLHDLSGRLSQALNSKDHETVRDLLGSDIEVLSDALTEPVAVERHAIFEAENFGSSMTPLYATIGLFVGALLIMVCVKPRVSPRVLEQLGEDAKIKPRHLFFGHFGVCAFVSLAQSTFLGLGNLFFLQVQAVHPFLFMLCYWVASLVFTFFIYALVVSFANLGKAIAVILLIVQVTGCNGSYPLPLLPWFVQAISPFLPATHVVAAMRSAMFGSFGGDFWIEMGQIAVWLVPALLLGLVLRKPFAKFMAWYVEKVEDSKLMA